MRVLCVLCVLSHAWEITVDRRTVHFLPLLWAAWAAALSAPQQCAMSHE